MNIPTGNVDMPSSETKLPNYNPKLYYYYNHDLIRRKITLKIDPGNDKDSFNIVIHKTLWKFIFDIIQYVMEQNHEYTYDRQIIKYMGKVLSKKDITFEEMNCKRDMVLDIVIEQFSLQSIVNDKILIYKIYHNNSSLIGKKCLNNQSNEIIIIKGFFTYRDDILAHAKGVINKTLMYVNYNSITLVDKSTSKRTRIKIKRYCDINFISPEKKTNLKNNSFLLLNVYLMTV